MQDATVENQNSVTNIHPRLQLLMRDAIIEDEKLFFFLP
jgi:hypothetical protein